MNFKNQPVKFLPCVLAGLCLAVNIIGCNRTPTPAKSGGTAKSKSSAAESAAAKTLTTPGEATVEGRSYRETIDLPGASVRGMEKAVIRAKIGGYVAEIGKMDDKTVDIGSEVKKDQLLAVLDVPEMKNELAEKQAMVKQAESDVLQAAAAIKEAESVVLQKAARQQQVKAQRVEKEALLKLSETKHGRLKRLFEGGNLAEDTLDEAKFEVDAARAGLVSIEADVKAAEIDIEAAKASVAKTMADKDSMSAKVTVAQAALDRAKTMMQYSTIRAPFAGIITNRMVDHGSFVPSADRNSGAKAIFELTRNDLVRVIVSVPNNKVTRVAPGMDATFHSIGGLSGKSFRGKITRTAGALDEKTRSMRVEVEFRNPVADERTEEAISLKPGLFGTLTVATQEWTDDAPLAIIPTAALGSDDSGNDFVVVKTAGEPLRRDVSVVFNDAISVGVTGEIYVGETVLTSGLNGYK